MLSLEIVRIKKDKAEQLTFYLFIYNFAKFSPLSDTAHRLFVRPSICIPICAASICVSIDLYIYLSNLHVCLSIHPFLGIFSNGYMSVCHLSSVGLLVCQSVGLSVCRSVGPSVSRSVGLLVCRSVGLLVCRSVCLSACLSVSLSVCQPVCLSAC
jgi:hypothetical protein